MSVFAQALGTAYTRLPPALQHFHAGGMPRYFTGRATIEHGHSVAAKIGIRLGGFPPQGRDVPFAITISKTTQGESWSRDFNGHMTGSTLRYDPAHQQIIERLGRVTCALSLRVEAITLEVDVARLWIFGVPVPTFLVPRSNSRELQNETGAICFDIGAQLPGGATLIRYHGQLMPKL